MRVRKRKIWSALLPYNRVVFSFLLLCLLFIQPVKAENELSGYYKNLLLRNGNVLLTGNRLRLRYLIDFSQKIKAELQYTNQFSFGQFPALSGPLNTRNFIKADRQLLRFNGLDWQHSFYRAYVSFNISDFDVVIGRQRIAWGTGRFWNPTDLLNTFDPTSIEGSERLGVDAINIQFNTDRLSFLSLVAAPFENFEQSSFATRYHTTIGPSDISLMTGKFKDSLVVGGDFSGSFKGAGLRVESSYTLSNFKNFWKAVFSVDYQLPRMYILGEYFFNGQGENVKDKYNYPALLNGTLTNLAQNYFGALMSYELGTLMSLSSQILFNLNDGSFLLSPNISFSISSNTDLVVGVNWFMGLLDTEFGRNPVLLFSQLQWNF